MHATLHVTLGHNSSAALAVNGRVIRAYEQERFDRKKSSSGYPRDAIAAAIGDLETKPFAYVSHWFDNFDLHNNKYLSLDHLRSVSSGIESTSSERTHHDLHASSAESFFSDYIDTMNDVVHTIVLDGFGSNQECFSLYKDRRLVHRTYGYENSLGLMYQYATEYLGLKPNRDEYKLLGYESHVLEYASLPVVRFVRSAMRDQADIHTRAMLQSNTRRRQTQSLIDYEALARAKENWFRQVNDWRDLFDVNTQEGIRAVVAFCAQSFLEACVAKLIDELVDADDGMRRRSVFLLCGGCHLNVKLNRSIQQSTNCRVYSHPLSGDQGAALGFIPYLDYGGLALGNRVLGDRDVLPIGVEIVDGDRWVGRASELLNDGKIVNVVRGSMEFGPRALCNTSTFAAPTKRNVAIINSLNERDEAMPMAPVMTRNAANRFLRNAELRMVGPSVKYMITTCAFIETPPERLAGVAHRDPLENLWTARPQMVDANADLDPLDYSDFDMCTLLSNVEDETLINTSFNYHGEPIVFTEDDACRTHSMQSFRANVMGIEPPVTLIVRSEA